MSMQPCRSLPGGPLCHLVPLFRGPQRFSDRSCVNSPGRRRGRTCLVASGRGTSPIGTAGAATPHTPIGGNGIHARRCGSRILSRAPLCRNDPSSPRRPLGAGEVASGEAGRGGRPARRPRIPDSVMPDAEADLVLAVNEAAANAIDHAYRTGDDTCSSRSGHRRTSPSPRRSPSPGDRPYICGPPGRCWPATHA
jgi:hypothetical protein